MIDLYFWPTGTARKSSSCWKNSDFLTRSNRSISAVAIS